jgi:hypothetical protein
MAQINITNLTGGKLSLDLTLDDGNIIIREKISKGTSIDVGDKCTIDDLNRSTQVQKLISDGKIRIDHVAEASDVTIDVVAVIISGPATDSGADSATISVAVSERAKTILSVTLFDPSGADVTKPGAIAANAVVSSASTGLILDGTGLASIVAETDEFGALDLVISNAVNEKIIIAAREAHGGPSISATSIHALTFVP